MKLNIIIVLTVLVVGLSGCTFTRRASQSAWEICGESKDWTDFKRTELVLDEGETLIFDFCSKVNEGDLDMRLYDEHDHVVIDFGVNIEDRCELVIHESGNYS